ncbi:ORC1-type DNA replication protein [uncultured archaeon]|nr:ORC1-type DNA replication protein [uncultured archaeon]
MDSFNDILNRPTIFRDRNVLSHHYIPETLPNRETEITKIMETVSPALNGDRTKNVLIYGKTGTGKTSAVKHVMEKFAQAGTTSKMIYINCQVYRSRYSILEKVVKEYMPEGFKPGYGVQYLYEKVLEWVASDGKGLICVLDEVDVVRDLDELVYTLTRSNDELKKGAISLIGISNKVSFKDRLDPRSRSSLVGTEMVFPPYTSFQLKEILRQRAGAGFAPGAVGEGAVNLAAAIAAQYNGDARYALKLLLKAGELADEKGETAICDSHVEGARLLVDEDVSVEAISTLPKHQQIVLYAVASLQSEGGKYSSLGDNGGSRVNGLLSGEAYERYVQLAKKCRADARGARWFREYLNDLEMLGLVTLTDSGKGQRGHTRFIKLACSPEKAMRLIEAQVLS